MFFAPLPLLFAWLFGLVSTAILVGGAYLVWAWYVGVVVGAAWLIAGLAMILLTFFGRWIVLLFRRPGPTEPGTHRPDSIRRFERPHTNPIRTSTASGFLRAVQKPLLEPLLHVTAWLAPVVWLMSWLSFLNGTAHILSMLFGFAGSETRGQLDRATAYNPIAWPASRRARPWRCCATTRPASCPG